jgi:hypothetical protein
MRRRPTTEHHQLREELRITRARLRELSAGDDFQAGQRAATADALELLRSEQQRHLESEARGVRITPSLALGQLIVRLHRLLNGEPPSRPTAKETP